jgi:uncharacterized RDD family membrane protein YckC
LYARPRRSSAVLAHESGDLVSQTPPPDGWGTPQPPDQPTVSPPPSYQPPAPPSYQPPPPPSYPPPTSDQPSGYPPPPNYPPPSAPNYPPPYGGGGGGLPTPPPVEAYGQPGGYGYSSAAGSLAGWWYRAGAAAIDAVLFIIVSAIISAAIGRAGGDVVGEVLEAAYLIILISRRGQTLGNMALRTKVVDAANGALPTPGRAAIRWVIQLLLGITVIGGILDILWPLWDSRNQTIHDKAAGTLVVRT